MDIKRVYFVVAGVLFVSLAAELSGIHLHSASWWPFPGGYNVFFGFFGCWILIVLSKIVMSALLQRSEGYYDDRGDEND